MVARAYTVAFEGIEARLVEVQCAISPGIPAFSVVCYIKKPLSISSWFKKPTADLGERRSEGPERAQLGHRVFMLHPHAARKLLRVRNHRCCQAARIAAVRPVTCS